MLPITTRPPRPELTYYAATAMESATIVTAQSQEMDLVKYQPPTPPPRVDSLLLAYFLMFARAPRKETPEVDGSYSLGEIGADAEKNWSRLTPYSIAGREP